MTDLEAAAAGYLSRGLRIIALSGKMPNGRVHRHGLHDYIYGAPETSEDFQVLRAPFTHPDTTGIGILTGYGRVVVDIDGPEGAKQWKMLVGEDEYLSDRWVASTGRGLHLWFACATPTGTIKLGPQLDLKGEGGYVAAPPSQHPSGGRYEWLAAPGVEPLMEVPEPLARIIEDHAFDLRGKLASKELRRRAYGPKWKEGDHVYYAQANHDALIEGVATAVEGNRNNYLHWAAATLAEEQGSDEEFEQLAEAALAVGLEPIEVKRTLRSARRKNGAG